MFERQTDQADGLRRLFAKLAPGTLNVAGPGGAVVTVNLADALNRLGHRVLILDRAHGEVASAMGLKSRYDLAQMLDGDKPLADVLLESPDGIGVLSAGRGLDRLIAQGGCWRQQLSGSLGPCADQYNIWLVNGLAPAAEHDAGVLLVTAPTAAAITDAYAQLKTLAQEHGNRDFRILIDHAPSESSARTTYENIAGAARRFLKTQLVYGGFIPDDLSSQTSRNRISGPRGQARANASTPRGHAFAKLAEVIVGNSAVGTPLGVPS